MKQNSNRNNSLRVPYALAVHDEQEEKRVLQVLKEHRTNLGQETIQFEEKVARLFGKKYGIMVNSGSSANLLAFEIMNLPEGSEVITPLLTFSTVVAPILQKKLVPVFTDVEKGKYIIDIDEIETLITKKTKALMVPLLFGNVPDMQRLRAIAKKHKLIFVEDSCDTLGASFNQKLSGTYSDISTTSFFGSHIITAGGNGGMVMVSTSKWRDKAKVLRGWGRSSSLFSESESISKRFKTKIAGIPYDAKFVFDEIGYNLLPNEMGAAFGNVQLLKLSTFRKTREKNFKLLSKFFKQYEDFFILPIQDENVKTQWLAFPLTIRKNAPFSRLMITTFLEKNNIQTRPIFAGNILKQPGFQHIPHRLHKNANENTDEIMERGFVVGCHHGLEQKHLEKMMQTITAFS